MIVTFAGGKVERPSAQKTSKVSGPVPAHLQPHLRS